MATGFSGFWREVFHAVSSIIYELDAVFNAVSGDPGLQEIGDLPEFMGAETGADLFQGAATEVGNNASLSEKNVQASAKNEERSLRLHHNRWLTIKFMLGRMLLANWKRKFLILPTVALSTRFLIPPSAMEAIQPLFYGLGIVLGFESLRHIDKMLYRKKSLTPHKPHSHEHLKRWLHKILDKNTIADSEATIEFAFVLPELLRTIPIVPAIIIVGVYAGLMPFGAWLASLSIFGLAFRGIEAKLKGKDKLEKYTHNRFLRFLHGHTRHHGGEALTKVMNASALAALWLGACIEFVPGGRLIFRASPTTHDFVTKVTEKIPYAHAFAQTEIGTLLTGAGTCAVQAAFPFAAYKITQKIIQHSPVAQQKIKDAKKASSTILQWSKRQPVVRPVLTAQQIAFRKGAEMVTKLKQPFRKSLPYKGLRVHPYQGLPKRKLSLSKLIAKLSA